VPVTVELACVLFKGSKDSQNLFVRGSDCAEGFRLSQGADSVSLSRRSNVGQRSMAS